MGNFQEKAMVNRIKGGLFGLLVGDALGVPYEFHMSKEIPPIEKMEMTPPVAFDRAHKGVRPGTWSDDGAQALCLLDSLLEKKRFDLIDFSNKLLAWYEEGLWAVDQKVFDVGVQTGMALGAYKNGMPAKDCGNICPEGKGNGALMRVLPLALFHTGSDAELVADAQEQCLITHANITNQVCCALYCLMARQLLRGADCQVSTKNAIQKLRDIYAKDKRYADEFEFRCNPDEFTTWIGDGGGYVVDSIRSAFMILSRAANYEDAVKQAIALGNDTDTTACVTGGLAGILFGYHAIPKRWLNTLKNKEDVEEILSRLLAYLQEISPA